MVAACPFPTLQGSQVFIGQLCDRLAQQGHEVDLLTYGQGPQSQGRGYRHHRIRRMPWNVAMRSGPSMIKPVLDALLTVALDRLVSSRRFDVLHCHNYEGVLAGLAVGKRRRVPVVYHSHNLMGDELGTYFRVRVARRLGGVAGRFLDRSVPPHVDHAIVLCEYTAYMLRRFGTDPARLSVIPPAVEDEGPARSCKEARRRIGLATEGHIVGYCGNLDGYQNLDLLLEAGACLKRQNGRQATMILIATHAPARSFQRKVEARGLESLFLILHSEDFSVARLAMEACDVLVLPRRYGSGYPLKLLNYMSLGRPLVVAGCGSKVIEDGVHGLIIRDDDGLQLATAISVLLKDADLAARLGRQARAYFLRNLTWNVVLPAIEAVYRKVCRAAAEPQRACAS